MKKILLVVFLAISINSLGQWAYPYKVYSENGKFFVKSIPFWGQVYTDLGKTIVCRTSDSLKVQYVINRYFEPDQLFVSNDGKAVCFIHNWFTPFPLDWDRNVIFFYKNGKLTHTYPVDQFIDSTLNRQIFSLLYKNEEVDSLEEISKGVRISVGVKKGTDPIETYLNVNNCFIKNDSIYILTQNQYANIFNINNGDLVSKQSFKDFTQKNLIDPTPKKIENYVIKYPIFYGLPKLSDGKDYALSFAKINNLKIVKYIYKKKVKKYKIYFIRISLSIDSIGLTNDIRVECEKNSSLANEMMIFLKNLTFDKNVIPKGIDKWYFNDVSIFRKRPSRIAIKEGEQETVLKEIQLQKKMVSDSIDGFYIPKDLNDCFVQLDKILNKVDKEDFRVLSEQEAIAKSHFSIGLWIRNNWGFWGGSRLQKYFIDLGIKHPDDMSGIILTSYHRFLNHKEIQLENQIQESKEYWENIKTLNKKNNQIKAKNVPPRSK